MPPVRSSTARPAPAAPDAVTELKALFARLAVANAAPPAPRPPRYIEAYPGSGVMIYNYNYYRDEDLELGELYGEKLGLAPRQVTWLNKFYPPTNNSFLDIEPARQATALLYLTVLPVLDRHLKSTGTTLAKTAALLEAEASRTGYETGHWYDNAGRGGKAGTDIYLAIFRLCENALRQYCQFASRSSRLFSKHLFRVETSFQRVIGQHVNKALHPLLPHVPPFSAETETRFNALNPARWKTRFAELLPLLPAKTPAFRKAIERLVEANVDNPKRENIYLEAAKTLAKADREAALPMYLHYLHDGTDWSNPDPKPLPKSLDKFLFPLPEHAARFQQLVARLEDDGNRKAALAEVPAIYAVERKKIALDMDAVQVARQQHSGTVELLNEYLQDEAAAPTPPKTTTHPAAKKAPSAAAKAATASSPPVTRPTTAFAPSLALTAAQQELLELFAAQGLVLSQAQAEALAQRHGLLRNQLIDGVNAACEELLDDVLIEESAEGYAIYAPYFQKIIK